MEAFFIIGRIILGALIIFAGANHLMHIGKMVEMSKMHKVPFPRLVVFVTGIVLLLSGLGIAFWVYVLTSLWMFLGFLVIVSFWIHNFWKRTDEQERTREMHYFMGNMMLVGLTLITIVLL